MSICTAKLELRNPRLRDLQPLRVDAVADSGSTFLILPESAAQQLKLERIEDRTVQLADGRSRTCPYVGPVEVHFENRSCFVGAVVTGDQVLLGAIPMEDMDLVVIPARRRVEVNPAHPNVPGGLAVRVGLLP
jgi:clan AA aspartic protease